MGLLLRDSLYEETTIYNYSSKTGIPKTLGVAVVDKSENLLKILNPQKYFLNVDYFTGEGESRE